MVCQRKLLRPTPQCSYTGIAVVVMAHGDVAIEEGEFIHISVVPHLEQVLPHVRKVRRYGIGQKRWGHGCALGINLSEAWHARPDSLGPGECTEEIIK